MKKLFLYSLLLMLPFSCNKKASEIQQTSSTQTAIENVHILPMTGDQPLLENQTILIEGGKIKKIGPSSEVKPAKGAKKINGKGKYLMPGLTEMHAHIPTPRDGDDTYVKETLFLYLSQGVTNIRGMLGHPYHLELKKMIAKEAILSPRVYTSSPSCNGNSIPSESVADEKVRQYKKDGYDFLKIHPGIKHEVMKKLVATAKEVGIPFSGHVPADVGVRNAIDFGYATIDHLDGYVTGMAPDGSNADQGGFFGYNFADDATDARLKELVQKTKAKGIAVVPTQTLFTRWMSPKSPAAMTNEPEMKYMPASTRYQWRSNKENLIGSGDYSEEKHARFVALRDKLLKALYEEGVVILAGSDAPQVFNVPGFSMLHELEDMADAGMPNEAVLHSATLAPAQFFKADKEFGSLQENASADLVLLDANPLDDISNIRQQAGVMVRGKWLSKAYITEELAKIAAKNQ